jgi:hypothetical protein
MSVSSLPGIMPLPYPQFFTNQGLPLAGGKIYTAEPGTVAGPGQVSPKATYTSMTLITPNANPVVLDSAGRANVWLSGYYKIALYDAAGSLVYTQDNVSASGADVSGTLTPNFYNATSGPIVVDLKGYTEYLAYKIDSTANTVTFIDTGGNVFYPALSSFVLSTGGQYVHLVLHAGIWYAENYPAAVSGITGGAVTENIVGGDITKKSAHVLTVQPIFCNDFNDVTALYIIAATDITIPSVASTGYFIYLCLRKADGVCDIRTYTSEALAAADAAVSTYRFIGWWPTNAATNVKDGILIKGELWYDLFTDNTINSATAVPANITTAIDISTFTPANRVYQVLIGGQAATVNQGIFLSGKSGTAQSAQQAVFGNNGAGDAFEWGNFANFFPVNSVNIYWGRGTVAAASNVQLAIHALKLRR